MTMSVISRFPRRVVTDAFLGRPGEHPPGGRLRFGHPCDGRTGRRHDLVRQWQHPAPHRETHRSDL